MISAIVTTNTISIVEMYALGGALTLVGIVAFATLLVSKDVTSTSTSKVSKRVSQALNIAFVPLLMVFLMILIAKLIETLS
jgi:ABC-type branched-subunit amino acid transport system permease subunit